MTEILSKFHRFIPSKHVIQIAFLFRKYHEKFRRIERRLKYVKHGSYFSRIRQQQPQVNKFLLFFEPHAAAAAACRSRVPQPRAAAACRSRTRHPHAAAALNAFEKLNFFYIFDSACCFLLYINEFISSKQ